jgi:hypothetical protein
MCAQCAVDLGKGLACRGKCEQAVAFDIAWTERIKQRTPYVEQITTQAKSNRLLGSAFYFIMGALFVGFGAYRFFTEGFAEPVFFFGLMGLAFLAFGCITLARALLLRQPPRQP